jgi:hypothetical protein
MIGIQYNNQWFDLLPDTRIQLSLKSPLFADNNIIPGSFSLPFDLPFGDASPKNTALLQHIDVVENSVRVRKIDVKLFYDANRYKEGTLKIGKVNVEGNRLSTNFQFGLSLLEDIKTLKLRDVVDETIVLNNNTTYVKEVRLEPNFPSSGDFSITLNGRPYNAGSIADLVTAINADTVEPRVQAIYFDAAVDYLIVRPFANQLDLTSPLTVDGAPLDWKVDANDSVWNGPVIAALDNYLSEPYPNNKFRMPTLCNIGMYDKGWQFFEKNTINASKNGVFETNYTSAFDIGSLFNPFLTVVQTGFTPFIMLQYVLDQIALHYGIEYDGDFYNDPLVAEALIVTPRTLHVKVPFIGTYEFLFIKQAFNLNEFLPELTLAEFFKALQTRFNLAVYYNAETRKLVLRKRKAILSAITYKDITAQCSPLQGLEDIGYTGLRLEASKDPNDKLFPEDIKLIGGEEELKIETACNSLAKTREYWHTNDDMPTMDQPVDKGGDYKFLRLVFYKGIEEAANGFDYPKAAVDPPEYTFRFDGVDSVYENLWKEYVKFLLTRKGCDLQQDVELGTLLAFDFEGKVMYDRTKYLYEQLTVTLNMQAIERASISLYSTTP